MNAVVKVLVVEDSENETERLLHTLKKSGFTPTARRVESAREMESALAQDSWDLIICDYLLPQFNGLEALKIAQRKGIDIPFVIVSDQIGEEVAVEALKAGAHDYVLKDHLTLLGPATMRAMRDAAGRRQRRQADLALQESEARYRRIVESAPEAIAVCAAGHFVYANSACVTMLGARTPLDLIGKPYLDFVDPSSRELVAENLLCRTQNGVNGPLIENRLRRLDGIPVLVEMTARAFSCHREQAVQIFCREISARKLMEEQIRKAERMDAIARLAGGVANDFNNLLTVIAGYAGLIQTSLPPGDKLRDGLEQITRSADRAFALTQEMMTLSRKQTIAPAPLNLNSLVAKAEGMLARILGDRVELHMNLAPGLSLIEGDSAQIEDLLINLVVRARDSILEGGRLLVQTRNVGPDDKRRLPPSESLPANSSFICLVISDSGPGVPAEAQEHVFEPFYQGSTPRPGNSGLALATVYAVVKQHGGHIFYQSHEGTGSTFYIYFPRLPDPDPLSAPDRTILLVEDEEPLRELGRTILKRAGYRVIDASDGVEALKMCEESKPALSLIFTDVILPTISGPEMTRRLSNIYPGIPVLYTSGYARAVVTESSPQAGDFAFLQKPYTSQELLERLHQILAAPAA